jgi:hypothetical protein
MLEVQTSEVDTIPAPFNLAQQWDKMDRHCRVSQGPLRLVSMVTSLTIVRCCKLGIQGILLTAEKRRHKGIAGF